MILDQIKTTVEWLPTIVTLVQAVENAWPEKGQGAVKLMLVKEILVAVNSGIESMWPAIETMIAAIVKAMNLTGKFKTTG